MLALWLGVHGWTYYYYFPPDYFSNYSPCLARVKRIQYDCGILIFLRKNLRAFIIKTIPTVVMEQKCISLEFDPSFCFLAHICRYPFRNSYSVDFGNSRPLKVLFVNSDPTFIYALVYDILFTRKSKQ